MIRRPPRSTLFPSRRSCDLTYNFYNTATPVLGTTVPVFTDTEAVGTDSISTAALAAGSYSFIAGYNTRRNFNHSSSPIDPLTLTKTDTSTATVIELNGTETVVTSVALVFFLMIRRPPRSTLFPTRRSSDLTYNFYNTATPVLGTTVPVFTDTEAVGTDSISTAALAAGSYSF